METTIVQDARISLQFYRDHGKENGNYYLAYWGFIGARIKWKRKWKMKWKLGLYRGLFE